MVAKRAGARYKGDAEWLCVQRATRAGAVPGVTKIRGWAEAALRGRLRRRPRAVTVRLVGLAEGRRLNETYRRRHGATNVLAFPAAAGAELGDIVICVPVMAREARVQGKAPAAHLAHLVVHGMLHLQGYDHHRPDESRRMERCEVQILRRIGFADPYSA
jgi:probable rRNA maturation factor